MYLLLDECCPKALVGIAEDLGHSAQRTIEVEALGRQASDPDIFSFACAVGAVIVTVNRGDFLNLATHRPDHPGLILLPSTPPSTTGRLSRALIGKVGQDFERTGVVVSVDAAGEVTRLVREADTP